MELRELEPAAEWRAGDVADPAGWTLELTPADHAELDHALATARAVSDDPLQVTRDHFPLDALADRLRNAVRELLDGRGFVRISALDVDRYGDADLTLLYWGIGLHLGEPWPQNKHGHVLGDVTDQGKSLDDPTFRGNELGGVALDYHTDGSDLVGLLCLRTAREGGLSCVANAVAIHNQLVREAPELAAALYEPLPSDLRGEQRPGGNPYYEIPAFTEHAQRLFVRFIPAYILASQRHPEAPRLSPVAKAAIRRTSELANDPDFNVYMDLQPGQMQFINNYHVLHGRTAYVDDPSAGYKRHLKRLWLATRELEDRPVRFQARGLDHWAERRSVSNLAAVDRPT
ncbi:MAG: Taurine catabolism dioxygenase TauD/TfdA [Acidimicrobiales bacterium]|nr:Taurine catabolism dioxygenase TauD/TfdA [Acidimicrobiales bacterium]